MESTIGSPVLVEDVGSDEWMLIKATGKGPKSHPIIDPELHRFHLLTLIWVVLLPV